MQAGVLSFIFSREKSGNLSGFVHSALTHSLNHLQVLAGTKVSLMHHTMQAVRDREKTFQRSSKMIPQIQFFWGVTTGIYYPRNVAQKSA